MNPTTRKPSDQVEFNRLPFWVKLYAYLTTTALGLVGLFLLWTAWATRNSNDWWLGMHDPLLGIRNRVMLVIGGLLHLAIAVYLFAARDLLNRTLAVLWMGLNHLIYYVGVHLVEPSALPNLERFIGWRLQLQPEAVDRRWKLFQLYLLVTGVVFAILIWRQSRRLGKEVWLKQWQEKREQTPKETSAAPAPAPPACEFRKNTCAHCGQKISFPLSRAGEHIACPHCTAQITLREPPLPMA